MITYFVLAYLIGSIPFGLILTKLFLKKDVREIGSGNVGATNVLRTGNKKLAAITLLLDALKGFLVTIYVSVEHSINHFYFPEEFTVPLFVLAPAVGLFAILGHCFPIWLKFKGGKGVATTIGVLLAAVPLTGLAAIVVWIMSFMASKISSLGAISAMIVAPAVTYLFYGLEPAIVNVAISVLVVAMHHENIKRLMKGEEAAFRSGK